MQQKSSHIRGVTSLEGLNVMKIPYLWHGEVTFVERDHCSVIGDTIICVHRNGHGEYGNDLNMAGWLTLVE